MTILTSLGITACSKHEASVYPAHRGHTKFYCLQQGTSKRG